MRKYLIVCATLFLLSASAPACAQRHRHTPRTSQTVSRDNALKDSSAVADTMAFDAYSDTTDTASDDGFMVDDDSSADDDSHDEGFWDSSMADGISAIGILFVCMMLPVVILAMLFYFIYKSRRQKIQLAEMAMKNGQPIPDNLLGDKKRGCQPMSYGEHGDEMMWSKGIKNVFLGIGLAVFFFFFFNNSMRMASIGLLVAIYGAGQVVIAKTTGGKSDQQEGQDAGDPDEDDAADDASGNSHEEQRD